MILKYARNTPLPLLARRVGRTTHSMLYYDWVRRSDAFKYGCITERFEWMQIGDTKKFCIIYRDR
jgi:hypothetical protein